MPRVFVVEPDAIGSTEVTLTFPERYEGAEAALGIAQQIYIDFPVLGTSDTTSASAVDESESEFHSLAEQWRRETGMFSSIRQMVMHPSYQRIIGMGARAIVPILRDLQRRPEHWFWALTYITGENPVPRESAGNLRQMAQAWLAWGRRRGYIS